MLGWVGLGITAVYLGALGFFQWSNLTNLSDLMPNEFGDFLAGAFGPLAIFWLILGFFQQGRELKNSVATLQLQAKELANSVEQQRELVRVSQLALEQERELVMAERRKAESDAQPKFLVRSSGGISVGADGIQNRVIILNAGEQATNVTLEWDKIPTMVELWSVGHWPNGKQRDFLVQFANRNVEEVVMTLRYNDKFENQRTRLFKLTPIDKQRAGFSVSPIE